MATLKLWRAMESLAVLLLLLGYCACRLSGQEPERHQARRPHAITVLGRDLVVWRDQQGDWRAFDDVCPHRLAPLSGRSFWETPHPYTLLASS